MKNYKNMKTNITSIFAAALVLFTASCANEETTKQDANQETAEGTNFVGGSAIKTRTSLDVTLPGGTTVDYFWEPNDKIWTADGATGTAQITAKSAMANFRMSKAYNTSTVDVYYPGVNATAYNQVTIATAQTQTEPNSTKHLGAAGDCGTATAHKQSDNSYKFDLDHKAAYLCLLPRTPNGLVSTYITQVKITSDNNIAGTYTLTKTGLTGSGSSNTITLTTPGDGTHVPGPYNYDGTPTTVPSPGFPLNNAATSQSTNAMYVVIAPGTHTLTIEYTIYDAMTLTTGTITKTISSTNYAENTVYPITANIKVTEYPGNEYYQWDAQQHYWAGYEWNGLNPTQPTIPGTSNSTDAPQSTAYTSAHTPRDFNDVMGYTDDTGTAPAVLPTTPHFQACPNVNELRWYAEHGHPHWDDQTLWATMGHLYHDGMWFKKKSKISGYSAAQAPDGIDYTRSTNNASFYNTIVTPGKPSNLNDYFYLPALGSYENGVLDGVGGYGFYWTSTPRVRDTGYAYYMVFVNTNVQTTTYRRDYGYRLWTAQ